MNREEAQRAAEERYPHQGSGHLRAAYMECYDAMTKGEPDGWCAWHPEKGLIVETVDPRKSEALYSLRKMFIHPQSLTPANIAVVETLGYKIVPVKLIICEDKDGKE